MHQQTIYTEAKDCKDCYKCVRECPTKAIQISNDRASVVDHMCIHCGHCVSICPTGAKKVRDGIGRSKFLIQNKKRVYVSLAPSYISEYGTNIHGLIYALHHLGFHGVSETALGAQEVSKHVSQFLKVRKSGVFISSACPVVVELIRKYYPHQTTSITPFMSPMLTHAKMLKQWYGDDIAVIFIGPCIGKKMEVDSYSQLIDGALTFNELNDWFEDENVSLNHFNNLPSKSFQPYKAKTGVIYPIDGGMADTIKHNGNYGDSSFLSLTGIKMIKEVMNNLNSFNQLAPTFLELLACETGCINGPGMSSNKGIIEKHQLIKTIFKDRMITAKSSFNDDYFTIERDFFDIQPIIKKPHSTYAIQEALLSIGKKKSSDELNCSGCGYDTCRDFAIALLDKKAETSMCVSYMRMVAQNKATILLQKIPSGVVIIDDQNKVVEMNANFARMLGSETEICYEATPGMHGADLDKIGLFSDYFKTALTTGNEYYELPIEENGNQLQLSIFNIQKHKLVTGIIQSSGHKTFQKDIVEKRTREVIKKNMETVQKIAFLLGENASYTDSLLNSILDSEEK